MSRAGARRYPTTHEQPLRTILRRWRGAGGQAWAELECGHEEPANDLPMATALRCRECNPVRRRQPEQAETSGGGW